MSDTLLSHRVVRLTHFFSAAPLVRIVVPLCLSISTITIITPPRCLDFWSLLELDIVWGFGGPAL